MIIVLRAKQLKLRSAVWHPVSRLVVPIAMTCVAVLLRASDPIGHSRETFSMPVVGHALGQVQLDVPRLAVVGRRGHVGDTVQL